MELLRSDRLPQIRFKADAVFLLGLKFRREVASDTAPGILRLVKCEVGLEDQIVDGGPVDRTELGTD